MKGISQNSGQHGTLENMESSLHHILFLQISSNPLGNPIGWIQMNPFITSNIKLWSKPPQFLLWTISIILSGLLASNMDPIVYSPTHRSQSVSRCFLIWPPNITSSPTTLPFATMVNLVFFKQIRHLPNSGPLHLLYPLPRTLFSYTVMVPQLKVTIYISIQPLII